MAAPTWQDFYDAGQTEALVRKSKLSFIVGDVADVLMAAAAAMADFVVGYAARSFAATFLDSATGDDLTRLADDHWDKQRKPANRATATVTLTRAGSVAGTIPAGTTVATERDEFGADTQFQTTQALSFLTTDTSKSVAVRAVVAGPSGNVGAATITRVLDTLFDTFTVTNAAAAGGGTNEESDEDLRERVRSASVTLRRATLKALEQGALSIAGVARAKAVDQLDGDGDANGIVDVYVVDDSGGSSSLIVDSVEAELENWRAGGIVVNVVGGTVQQIGALVLEISLRPGTSATVAGLAGRIADAVAARVNKLQSGENLLASAITQAVLNVDTDAIGSVAVTTPATTPVVTASSPGHTIRIEAAAISVLEAA